MKKNMNGLSRWVEQRWAASFLRKALRLGCAALLGFALIGTAQAAIPASERAVLINLYNSTNGANWTNKTGWNGAAGTECSWVRVSCDGTQSHVTGIDLSGNRLAGTLPSLSGLTALQDFAVSNNQLTGAIPSLFGLTALLNFHADNNQLTGSIPSFNEMTALQTFWIHSNQLTGAITAAPRHLLAGQSDLCNNQLLSSGSTSIDAAWTTAAGSWLSCQREAIAIPDCQLTASPSSIVAGAPTTLTASCNPAASSYTWTGAGCESIKGSICTVTPTATTSYSVTGSNATGTAPPRTVTVTVSTPSATTAPVCTLTTWSPTFTPGDQVLLTTNCTPAATSYVWTGGGCAGITTAICSDFPTVATTYTVIASNDKGPDSKRTVSVTPSGTTPPPSTPTISCALSASPSTPIAPGMAVKLTASCTPAATSYVWTGVGCAGPSCTVTPMTTTTYSVTGSNASASSTKTVIVTVNATATTAPVCTLISSGGASAITPGDSIMLFADCTGSPTAYTWTGSGCETITGSSCAALPMANTTFTVRGSNSIGMGNVSSFTVTLAQPSSACSLTATPSSVAVGEPYTLTGKCGASNVMSAKWSGEGCSAETGLSCTVKSTKAGTFAYSVAFTLQAGVLLTAAASVTVTAAAASYQGLWWNPNESGWGISLTQHADKIFAAIYTYDAAGQPTWYALSDCPIKADKPGRCTGDIYKVTGGSTPLAPWVGPVKPESKGTGTFTFTDTGHGQFDYMFKNDGVAGSKTIEKFAFASGTASLAADYTNLWMTPDESGWGVALTQDQGMIFAAWYTYNTDGNPVWYWSMCPLTGNETASRCNGALFQTTGGVPLDSSWSITRQNVEVGELIFTFSGAAQGEMIVAPITGTLVKKKIIPFVF